MYKTLTAVCLAVVAAVLALAGCDLVHDTGEPGLRAFGSMHAPIGEASLAAEDESVRIDLNDRESAGGVAVELLQRSRLNVYFEPIEMPIGSYFEAAVTGRVGDRDRILGRITHRQTGPHTTAIGVDFHEVMRFTESDRLTVSTYYGGIQTYSTSLSTDSMSTVGFVSSAGSEWATSYHWVYIDGSWILMVDPAPAETFTFVGRPAQSIPFNYLVFQIDGVEGIARPEAMEFLGEGLARFTVVGEDERRLIF